MENFLSTLKRSIRRLVYDEDIADGTSIQEFSMNNSGEVVSKLPGYLKSEEGKEVIKKIGGQSTNSSK